MKHVEIQYIQTIREAVIKAVATIDDAIFLFLDLYYNSN